MTRELPDDVLERAEAIIAALEAHSDPQVGELLYDLLAQIDAVHRTALTHLMDAIRGMAGDAFINRLTADPAIRLLLMSYDLLAVDRRLLAEEALDTVRGHLHAHGIDVEVGDVVGGVVYVRLHGIDASGVALDAVRRDLESALQSGLIGFQELELADRLPRGPKEFVQIAGLRRAQRPIYRRVLGAAELNPGALASIEIDGRAILLANVDGSVHAVADQCGDTPLPLRFGRLEGTLVRCSWHGCRYDVRTGHRVDGEGRLEVFPVRIEEGGILLAVATEAVMQDAS